MKTVGKIYGVGILATLLVAGLGVGLSRRGRATDDRLDRARADSDSLRVSIEKTKVAVANAEHELARIHSLVTHEKEATAETSPAKTDHLHNWDTNARFQVLRMNARRASLFATYEPFYRAHQMSPEMIRRFEESYIKHEQDKEDLAATQRLQHYASDNPAIAQLQKDSDATFRSAVTEIVGDKGYQDLRQYNRTSDPRQFVSGIVGNATVHGIAFTPEQADQLVATLAANSPAYQSGGWAQSQDVDWEQVDRVGAGFLSAEQLNALRTFESRGPDFVGSRTLSRLNAVITAAAKADAPDPTTNKDS